MGALQPAYWQALSVVCLLYFARFDASFITLRARTVRVSVCRFLGLCNPKHRQDCMSCFAQYMCLPNMECFITFAARTVCASVSSTPTQASYPDSQGGACVCLSLFRVV